MQHIPVYNMYLVFERQGEGKKYSLWKLSSSIEEAKANLLPSLWVLGGAYRLTPHIGSVATCHVQPHALGSTQCAGPRAICGA